MADLLNAIGFIVLIIGLIILLSLLGYWIFGKRGLTILLIYLAFLFIIIGGGTGAH